jgi:hypothetical protein
MADCLESLYPCNHHRRGEEVGENSKNIWIWITLYKKIYRKDEPLCVELHGLGDIP